MYDIRRKTVYRKPKRRVTRCFIHCSASDVPAHDDISVMRRWHIEERGFDDVGYNFFITKSGRIQPGRHLETVPAAQKGHNSGTVAVCLHGLLEHNFKRRQFDALKQLARDMVLEHEGEITFHGHCEVNKGKTCPVFDYRRVLNLDHYGATHLRCLPPKHMAEASQPINSIVQLWDVGPLVRRLQLAVGAKTDGVYGPNTKRKAVKAIEPLTITQGHEWDPNTGNISRSLIELLEERHSGSQEWRNSFRRKV